MEISDYINNGELVPVDITVDCIIKNIEART